MADIGDGPEGTHGRAMKKGRSRAQNKYDIPIKPSDSALPRYMTGSRPNCRAMTSRWISLVPSPISSKRWSR